LQSVEEHNDLGGIFFKRKLMIFWSYDWKI